MKNISTLNRVFRITLSLGLVVAVLSMSGPVGGLVYALFISIYAGITAFIGWDPAVAALDYAHKYIPTKTDMVHQDKLLHH